MPNSPLSDIQHLAWLHQPAPPKTNREAVSRLLETVRCCLRDLDDDQLVSGQERLEDTLLHALIAMKSLGMNPDQALQRALSRLQLATDSRTFHIFPDRVEIRVLHEVRGEWPLYEQRDLESALRMARELGCDVVYEEAHQLELFAHVRGSA